MNKDEFNRIGNNNDIKMANVIILFESTKAQTIKTFEIALNSESG